MEHPRSKRRISTPNTFHEVLRDRLAAVDPTDTERASTEGTRAGARCGCLILPHESVPKHSETDATFVTNSVPRSP